MSTTQPDFVDRLLRDTYPRRIFYFTFILFLLLVVILRTVALPWQFTRPYPPMYELAGSVLDALLATGTVTLLGSFLFFWLTPSWATPAEIEVVYPHRISKLLKQARSKSKNWDYSGGLGRFTTSVTIPELADSAQQANVTSEVTLLILNPDNETVCEEYANYKNGLRSTDGSPWSASSIQQEALASILLASYWNGRSERISITIGLKDVFSIFRIDLSSEYAVITKEDPKEPALKTDVGTFFYESYKEELRAARQQSIEIPPSTQVTAINAEAVQRLVEEIPIEIEGLNEEDNVAIAELAKKRESPY